MESLNRIIFGILILQIYVHAAPGDVSKLEDIAKVEQAEPKLDAELKKEVKSENESSESQPSENNSNDIQRQKRWYNPYAFGIPPVNPPFYPNFQGRNDGPNPNYYGGEDPLAQIHRRIQEIADIVRQPQLPPQLPQLPSLPQLPIFYPILYIPPGDCRCNENPAPATDSPPTPDNNGTTPDIFNRWPVMEDERQNWGFLINETESEEGDFSRPISFDPIRLNKPIRPPPPVEHGSVQSDSNDQQQNSVSQPLPPTQTPPPVLRPSNNQPSPFRPQNTPQNRPQNPPQNRPQSGAAPPSPCEGAILTCCHQPRVSYDCFAIQGCPDFTGYGNPCDPRLILRVIERFQNFYKGPRFG